MPLPKRHLPDRDSHNPHLKEGNTELQIEFNLLITADVLSIGLQCISRWPQALTSSDIVFTQDISHHFAPGLYYAKVHTQENVEGRYSNRFLSYPLAPLLTAHKPVYENYKL